VEERTGLGLIGWAVVLLFGIVLAVVIVGRPVRWDAWSVGQFVAVLALVIGDFVALHIITIRHRRREPVPDWLPITAIWLSVFVVPLMVAIAFGQHIGFERIRKEAAHAPD
jgi:hypothetical protein